MTERVAKRSGVSETVGREQLLEGSGQLGTQHARQLSQSIPNCLTELGGIHRAILAAREEGRLAPGGVPTLARPSSCTSWPASFRDLYSGGWQGAAPLPMI